MTDDQVSGSFWAQVEPVWNPYWPEQLDRLAVRHVTKRKPRNPIPGCVLVKLTVAMPAHAFVPRELAGEVTVPDGSWEPAAATVQAEPLNGDAP
jgi:hypothetical protein